MKDSQTTTVSQRVIREAWILLGPLPCSIVMQVAHSRVAQGVDEHSDFREHPARRARGTAQFVYALAFGTAEETDAVTREVRAAHRRVRGRGYSANDPDLQTWVAATGYFCYVDGHERLFGPLTEAERDEAHRQFAGWATVLGCPADRWPATREEFDAYWRAMVSTLEVGPTSRAVVASLFRPAQWWLRPLTTTQRFFTSGLLPPEIRRRYGLPWSPGHQRAFDLTMHTLRLVYPRIPLVVRELPMTYYLWDLRHRLARERRGARPVSETTPHGSAFARPGRADAAHVRGYGR
ncbi:oxygenase MpaB family protein [Spiractinospora alimapuensis]|uniref:oxygenase MpaB family protein n=1 Tax=Spiractinospora alimapuensis TaxID=2820884 RepID=UPI001F256C9F|nr:oxygenase MpaB family protein [Spiractinospora alimapuensis]